jgi:hypothetical protein
LFDAAFKPLENTGLELALAEPVHGKSGLFKGARADRIGRAHDRTPLCDTGACRTTPKLVIRHRNRQLHSNDPKTRDCAYRPRQ